MSLSSSITELKGRIALVTGSGRGLGKAIALAYCKVGCNVIGVARSIKELKKTYETSKELKGDFKYFRIDVSNDKDVEHLFNIIKNDYGC